MTSKGNLLCSILDCGELDLGMLDEVGYDWCDVMNRLKEQGVGILDVGFNGLMRAVVEMGVEDLATAVNDRVCELEAIPNERELDEDEKKEMEQLLLLSPEDDVEAFFNYLDTHAYLLKNGQIYREYLPDALDEFEENTGICMEGY